MTTQEAEETTEFPQRLGNPALRALAHNGYTRFEQLASVTSVDLLKLHGMGPRGTRILEEELAARGLSFADS